MNEVILYRGVRQIWFGMKQRCNNPKHEAYARYGGRGIKICERWESFQNFMEDMGPRPGPEYSIERLNNDLGYEPSNCKWATRTEQSRNTRNNRRLTYNGETLCVSEWAERFGLHHNRITKRLESGWSVEEALTTPASASSPRRRRGPEVEFRGLSLTFSEWSLRTGINKATINMRLRAGWSVEEALTTPPGGRNQRTQK